MRALVVSCALLCAASLAAPADHVTEQVQQGWEHYEQGDLSGALNEPQCAIRDIRSQLAETGRVELPRRRFQEAGRHLI